MIVKICTRCGRVFGLNHDDGRVKLCPKCAKLSAYVPVKKDYGECPICGKLFLRSRRTQLYCSTECRNKRNEEAYKKGRQVYAKKCLWCGKVFTTMDSRKVYHSHGCYKKAKIWRDKNNGNNKK